MRKRKFKNVIIAWLLVFSMVIPNVTGTIVVKAEDTAVKNYDAMTMDEILDSEEPLTWVFAGDSITHNATWTQGMNSYSEWFEQYLYSNEVDRKKDAVINTAWGGATIRDFQTVENTPSGNHGTNHDAGEGLDKYVLSYKPDVVFIKVGMNDRGMATTTFIQWYTKTIDSIYEAGLADGKIPKIIVLTPTPISGENIYDDIKHKDRGETTVNNAGKTIYYNGTLRFRNALEQFVTDYNSEKQRNILFCDLRTAFIKEAERLGDDYLSVFFRDPSDGEIHPNAAGQYLMFKTLCQTLKIDNKLEKIFQFNYSDLNWAGLYVDGTDGVDYENGYANNVSSSELEVSWADSITENYVWAIAGAEQMSGYNGLQVNRSLMRQLDNAMRAGAHHPYSQRDIRLVNAAAPGNTIASMINDYEDIIGKHDADVLLLLPEISHVYASDYVHSEEAVEEYKTSVNTLLAKSEAKVNILWSPLASGNDTINTYINDYANAAREIATESSSLLFFDANKFMNDNMTTNASLKRNWFDDEMDITPLAAVDVAIAFYTSMDEEGAIPTDETGTTKGICYSELINHNLRYTTDKRVFKGEFVRDNIDIADTIAVNGTTVTLDVSAIKTAYANADITIKVMPAINAGNYYEGILDLTEVAEVAVDGNVYTFTSPCKFLNLAIYGKQGEIVYRFKDISITVEGAADAYPTKPMTSADGVYLTSLEVVGAPKIEFDKDKTNYDVNLYQYQQFVRIVAKAHEDLTITVNGEEVESGVNSQMITISEPNQAETVTVKVSGTVNGENVEKIYTLNLSRPEYPDIIVTEVMAYSNSDKFDLVEIYNASGKTLNLADYSIGYKRTYPAESVAGADVSSEDLYYFTGNDQTFGKVNYTGVNPITKYSTYWDQEQLTEIPFEKDSTMVIWVKTSGSYTYDDLLNSMKSTPEKNMTVEVDGVDKEILPDLDQLVVAEAPSASAYTHATYAATNTMDGKEKKFYLARTGSAVRCWVFVLDKDAQVAENGAITEAGDDIISAARFNRVALEAEGYSDAVMSYNTERGVSLVKDQMNWVDTLGGHTTDEQGYGTLTSFGAIEYWQKPVDFDDTKIPEIEDFTKKEVPIGRDATVELKLTDDSDVRYVTVYARNAGETEYEAYKKDIVLETSVKNKGLATDVKEFTYSCVVGEVSDGVEYYAEVVDGNNHMTTLGSAEEPMTICEELQAVEGYDVADAKNYIGKKAPKTPVADYVFSGWYADEECKETPIASKAEAEAYETVYALFVPQEVLGVKAQILSSMENDDATDDATGNIRFVTTVDSENYQKVGFNVSYDADGDGVKTLYKITSKNVYRSLEYMDTTDGSVMEYYPEKEFNELSKYFMAVTVKDMTEAHYDMDMKVTPFWVTMDGVTVKGKSQVKRVNDRVAKFYEAKDDTAYYTALEDAVNAATADSTITLFSDAEVEAAMAISQNITLANRPDRAVTIYRGTGLATANMFTVATGGTLTIKGDKDASSIVFDGRTVAETLAGKDRDAATGSSGSMIRSSGTVNLNNVTVQYMKRTASNADGGAIHSLAGATLNVKDAVFDNNATVRYGSVVYSKGAMAFENTTFTNNEASGNGGVLCNHGGTSFTVEGCTFNGNSGASGGVIWNSKTATITDSTFQSNSSTASGGAIHTSSPDVTIDGCKFIENIAVYGGAISTPNTTVIAVNVDGCEFEKNSASTSGGAINFGNATTGTITNAVFEGNQSPIAGAITVATGGKVSFADCEFEDNKNTGSTYEGDDIRLGGATCEIKISGKFVGNVNHRNSSKVQIVGALTEGSAVELDWYDRRTHSTPVPNYFPLEAILFVDAQGNANANAEEVEANKNYIQLDERTYNQGLELEYDGTTGTVVVDTSVATVNGTPCESLAEAVNIANTLASEETTVVTLLKDVEVESAMEISTDITIQNKVGRSIKVYRGTGLAAANMFNVTTTGSLTIQGVETADSLIFDGRTKAEAEANTGIDAAAGSTASLINNNGTVNLNDVTVQYVKRVDGNGSVIYNQGTSFNASGCTFSHNRGKEGGVIWSNKHYTVDGCTFTENSSTTYGGVILNRSTANITNSTFRSNQAGSEGGVISTIATTGLIIENCYFIENSATSGGAIRTNANTIKITITGCEFKGNRATGTSGSGGALVMGAATTVTVTDTVFAGNEAAIAGAVTVATGGKASFTDCEFKDNSGKSEGNDVRLGGATSEIKIFGKFVGNVYNRNKSTVQIVGALSAGSAVELDWYKRTDVTFPYEAIVTFASSEVENASKEFIKLGTLTTGYGWKLVDSATENALDLQE